LSLPPTKLDCPLRYIRKNKWLTLYTYNGRTSVVIDPPTLDIMVVLNNLKLIRKVEKRMAVSTDAKVGYGTEKEIIWQYDK